MPHKHGGHVISHLSLFWAGAFPVSNHREVVLTSWSLGCNLSKTQCSPGSSVHLLSMGILHCFVVVNERPSSFLFSFFPDSSLQIGASASRLGIPGKRGLDNLSFGTVCQHSPGAGNCPVEGRIAPVLTKLKSESV